MSEVRSGPGYVDVGGIRMYYEIHGAGRPLVLVHGGMLTIDLNFGGVIPALSERNRVIGVELQGHGHTHDSERDMTLDALSGDVVALLDHLDIATADFFGFSLGGMIAIHLALTHPERVRCLVVASAPYRKDGYHPDTRAQDADPTSPRMPTAADGRLWKEEYRKVAPHPDNFGSLLAKASRMVGSFTGWSADELRSIKAPTLLLFGDTDFVTLDHAIEMTSHISDARLGILPGATHMDMTRRDEQVLSMVVPFLEGTL